MDLFGVKVPGWMLAVLALLIGILVVSFAWSTVVGLMGLLFKIAGLIALALVGIWAYRKFARR